MTRWCTCSSSQISPTLRRMNKMRIPPGSTRNRGRRTPKLSRRECLRQRHHCHLLSLGGDALSVRTGHAQATVDVIEHLASQVKWSHRVPARIAAPSNCFASAVVTCRTKPLPMPQLLCDSMLFECMTVRWDNFRRWRNWTRPRTLPLSVWVANVRREHKSCGLVPVPHKVVAPVKSWSSQQCLNPFFIG